MPRRNRPQPKRRRGPARAGAALDTPTIRRTVEAPPAPAVREVREVRACIVCAQPLPLKWPHPEHASCYVLNLNTLTEGENHR